VVTVTTAQASPDRHDWERSGPVAVAADVYRIPLPLPGDALRAVNVYAIADGDGLVLVDGGWAMAESVAELTRALGELDHRLTDIREFLVTHVHRDHYTQAVALRRTTGSTVALGVGEQATLDAINSGRPGDGGEALRRAGAAELAEQLEKVEYDIELADWGYPDRWLDDSTLLPLESRTLRVVATPGHTRGHVVFHDARAGTLFAGDHVLPHITPSLGVEPAPMASPLSSYLASLRLILGMPDALLLPAHGPVRPSTHARVHELLRHHRERLDQTFDAVSAGASTGFEVAGQLRWTRRLHRLADLDLFNAFLAVNETVAHLRVLVEQGNLVSRISDGVETFTVA
jgi:glyoxylase-like metal-dependent hydrolase (beta-lactamase superfamily II)